MERFAGNLEEAEKQIQKADHLIYMIFPLAKDKRMLIKAVLEIKEGITKCINSILQYEYLYKRVKLYQDPKTNLRIFKEKCAPVYEITKEELEQVSEIFEIVKKHNESPFEFTKENKIIILSKNMEPQTITIEKIKEFLITAKNVLKKAKSTILR